MTDHERAADQSGPQKDPSDWVTGGEPMTEAQASYLKTLAADAGETFDDQLTKAEASERIEELRQRSGRSQSPAQQDARSQRGAATAEKDPNDWVTGDEPMTAAQASYLQTLTTDANEPFDETLTKAEASKRIDELQQRTGRGGNE